MVLTTRWWEDARKMEKLAARQGCEQCSAGPPRPPPAGVPEAGLTCHVRKIHLQLIQQHAAIRLEGHRLWGKPRGERG